MRAWVRWSLLIGFAFGMATWIWTFDAGGPLMIALGAVLWFALGVMGAVACGLEAMFASRYPDELARMSPGWGAAVWVLCPVVFVVSEWVHLDARLWFTLHRSTLESAVAEARAEPPGRSRLGGFDVVRSREHDVVVLSTAAFMLDRQGFLYDPTAVARIRDDCPGMPGWQLSSLIDFGGGWRLFRADG